MSVIYLRRSIRKYKKTAVDNSLVDEIIRAAMYAPSAGNTQPWHFIVFDDKEKIKKIQDLKMGTTVLDDNPVVILICGDRNLEKRKDVSYADLGAATENLLLRAKELGLGTCWLSIFPDDETMNLFSKQFKLPPDVYPFCAVALGYADEERHSENRFDKSKIHYNEW